MGALSEFKEFLNEYKIIPLTIAFVMGLASVTFIQSVVNHFLMPILTPFIPGGAWRTATFSLGPIVIGWGELLGATINFGIIAFVVFMVAKFVLKEKKVAKK